MPALQVRDFPDELYVQLKECADNEHRSIAQQTIVAVEEMLRARASAAERREGGSAPAGVEAQDALADRVADAVASRTMRTPSCLDFSTEAERQARIQKRKEIFARIDRMNAERTTPPPSAEQVVQWVREGREEHTNDILVAAGYGDVVDRQKAQEAWS